MSGVDDRSSLLDRVDPCFRAAERSNAAEEKNHTCRCKSISITGDRVADKLDATRRVSGTGNHGNSVDRFRVIRRRVPRARINERGSQRDDDERKDDVKGGLC